MQRFLWSFLKQGAKHRILFFPFRNFVSETKRCFLWQQSKTTRFCKICDSTSLDLSIQISIQHFSLSEDKMADNRFSTDYDKRGQASCKKCKQKIGKGGLRIAKVVANFFSEEGGDMKQYFHPKCIFETFVKARATTKIIEDTTDIEGFADLEQEDKDTIKELIKDILEKKTKKGTPKKATPKKAAAKTVQSPFSASSSKKSADSNHKEGHVTSNPSHENGKVDVTASGQEASGSFSPGSKDNAFRQFRRLCADIAEESSYLEKTKITATFLKKGTSGNGFEGDVYLLLKLLLPGVVKVVYNLNSKQLVKIFSQIFGTSLSEMVEDLENGDVAETVKVFFEKSAVCEPQTKSVLTIQEVDNLLTELSKYTKEDDQQQILTKLAKKCTANDLKMVIRLIKHDLRINSGAKHILDGLDPNAYEAFQASRNLRDVVDRVMELRKENGDRPGMSKSLSVRASLMTPVLPMLAEACKSVDMAFKKCPNGMYAELKYDGERVQVHKQEDEFRYFSRSLKPVLPHKVSHFKDWIPKAFPGGSNLILDSEVLLIDTNTSTPLPFGTLGKHKKEQFKDANVCLFIFDCLNYNGKSLMDKPIKERRKFLYENMTEIPNRILFSEMKHVTKPSELKDMMADVFNKGLEGLVLKDVNSTYEPGKRHWLKVKKDYLAEGAMADSADLIVLGAYFGTGNKGGLMSIFLMGCYDEGCDKFVTVTKCGSGFDDQTLDRLQKQFHPQMVKVSRDYSKVPDWLKITRGVMPDFLVKDPKVSSVWEISGAEFSKAEIHTAAGISIRFPRCTKMRDDKSWKEATSLGRLKELVKTSKEKSDFDELLGASKKKGKASPSKSATNSESESKMDVTEGEVDDNLMVTEGSPVKTPSKRKSESDLQAGENKKRRDDKPVCKYGANCYQKNPEHLGKYAHPSESSPTKGLPDFLKGMKFYLGDLPNAKKLKRYIIAYDGDVVADYDQQSALRVVEEKSDSGSKEEVTVDWLMACIKKKTLLPR